MSEESRKCSWKLPAELQDRINYNRRQYYATAGYVQLQQLFAEHTPTGNHGVIDKPVQLGDFYLMHCQLIQVFDH